ncbi:MAG TPA: hypothetical protein VN970_02750, partial [Thermoanaerobaculia bacterium]|nr:hypothetical protein [Thermoanaerobaculia bacterium]
MGEIDDLQDAEDEREPDRHQRVEHADDQAVAEQIEEEHARAEPPLPSPLVEEGGELRAQRATSRVRGAGVCYSESKPLTRFLASLGTTLSRKGRGFSEWPSPTECHVPGFSSFETSSGLP